MNPFILGFHKGFKQFAETASFVINTVLLTIVYFVGVGPVAIISKLRKKKYLELQTNDSETYWIDHDDSGPAFRMW